MKNFLILFCCTCLCTVGCKTKAPVSFGLLGCYELSKGEQETVVTKEYLRLYDNELRVAETQSFINKFTVSKKDKKYFGFVLADVVDTIISKINRDNTIKIFETKKIEANESVYHYFKIKKSSGLKVIKVLHKQQDLTNSVMIDVVFDNEESWDEFYKKSDEFIAKFNCEHEKE